MNNFNKILTENTKELEGMIVDQIKQTIGESLYEYTSWDVFCEDNEIDWDELKPILQKVWKRNKNKIK